MTLFTTELTTKLNEDIALFPQVFPITDDMKITYSGVSQLIMLDRYTFKDTEKKTLKVGDFVVLTIKQDPKFPARGFGYVLEIDRDNNTATVKVDKQFGGTLEDNEIKSMTITRSIDYIDKPLEIYWEQIAKRNAKGLASVEETEDKRKEWERKFYEELVATNVVPGGRVIYGAGTDTDVTFFNCFVQPFVRDSREGIAIHRKEVMEIMSRGGGCGTNGSTLRPRNALARGVNGKSSGSVSWLNDIAELTHLVSQGGSRRGAQMIMLADWSPDILEFIISKMQNPTILRFIIENTNDDQIRELAKNKLKFTPFTHEELNSLKKAKQWYLTSNEGLSSKEYRYIKEGIELGGTYSVHNPEFLSGANISVAITKEFMEAVDNDADYPLRFPDVENYDEEMMRIYNEKWHEIGDVREWESLGYAVKTYRTIKARELWQLINICATYSAEPGIFFIDNANDMTNAKAYGQKVVCTNPCGEQPLAPYSVCNLAAINLANMADKTNKTVDFEKLKRSVSVAVRLQDNVIDATPYFLEENTKQALSERRIGLGVMGLADMLIYCEKVYGSPEGNELVDKVFETITTTAYRTSIELAKEKGSFPFLDDKHDRGNRYKFAETGFVQTLPDDIRDGIRKHGIRNSHLITVAPTGSTGSMVNVATGLEPYFSFKYYRSGRLGKFMEVTADIVSEYYERYYEENPDAEREPKSPLPPWFVTAMELAPEAHVDVQCVIQRWVDSSISKTVNAPKGYSVSQVQAVYERLYKGGAKGGTVYVDGSRDTQVLTLTPGDDKDDKQTVETKKVVLVNTVNDVRSTSVKVGDEVGETCPICREGTVIDSGGCHTCSACGAQLRCGL